MITKNHKFIIQNKIKIYIYNLIKILNYEIVPA